MKISETIQNSKGKNKKVFQCVPPRTSLIPCYSHLDASVLASVLKIKNGKEAPS
jgi:hypothetical protein